ncbi:hypothetical protein ONZ45_g1577 [Pleurotus djamor]|nr:hypothetical protein ONZ45_g1577 [Pleurotus djamor]
MIVARIIQGIGSALVWIIGCDCSPPEVVGRKDRFPSAKCHPDLQLGQLGVAMSGLASGSVLGPPLGSLLYDRFSMAGPLTFGASVVGLDLIGRLLIIERHDDILSNPGISPEVESRQVPSNVKIELYSSLRIMKQIAKSPRLICSLCLELFGFGMVNTMIDTGLPLRLKDDYGLTITQVGLFLIAGGAPSFVAPPIGGYLSDKLGTEWTILLGVALSIPWWPLLLIHMKVGCLIAIYAFGRFISVSVYAACYSEMARASKRIECVGCKSFSKFDKLSYLLTSSFLQDIHVYAMSILAYGIGAVIGPILAGQLYANFHNLGWTIICIVIEGTRLLIIPFLFLWTGDAPLRKRLQKAIASSGDSKL